MGKRTIIGIIAVIVVLALAFTIYVVVTQPSGSTDLPTIETPDIEAPDVDVTVEEDDAALPGDAVYA